MADEPTTEPTATTGGEPGPQTPVAEEPGGAPDARAEKPNGDAKFTQADIDRIVADRLRKEKERTDREAERIREEERTAKLKEQEDFKGLYESEQKRVARLEKQVEEMKADIAAKDRAALCARVASEEKLPADFADRLVGDDEAALREDAKRLAKHLAPPSPPNLDIKNGNGKLPKNTVTEEERQKASRHYATRF